MFGRKQRIEHLREVPLFSSLNSKELSAIARIGDETDASAGQVLMREGDEGNEGYVIMHGEATVTRGGRKLSTLGAGDVAGELALLARAPRSATVTCATDCKLLSFDRIHFAALLEEAPTLTLKLMQSLASRIRELDRATYG